MGSQKDTISINGKLYNAKTGTFVAPSGSPPKTKTAKPTQPRAMDGFFKVKTPRQPVRLQTPKPAHKPAATAKLVHSKTQRSKTLARVSVKKPLPRKPLATSFLPASAHDSPTLPSRTGHASKSNLISRFGNFATPTILKKTVPLAVKQQPVAARAEAPAYAPTVRESKPKPNLDALLNDALDKAHSHEERRAKTHKKHRLKRRIAGASAGVAAVLILGLFFTYQNAANLSVKLAAARASVHVSIPGYQPSGFGLARTVQYQPGRITLNYQSNSDNRSYQVTQQTSNWNSETLYTSFVSANQRQSQTISENGRTIYLYDGTNATWVDGGVWYQISGNTALSSSQLLKVASSI